MKGKVMIRVGLMFVWMLAFIGFAHASFLTKIEFEITGLTGISQLDNSDGTLVSVSIINSSDEVVVSRNAAAGIYLPNMSIVMTGAKFSLEYSTDYVYNLSTIYGDFSYEFTTPAPISAPTVEWWHSGQTQCYDASNNEDTCSATYEGQDGQDDGAAKSYTDNGDDTVTDDYTNLMWMKYDSGSTALNWTKAIEYCKNNETGGYTDWRLPSVFEIGTMMDLSCLAAGNPAYCYSDFQNNALQWSTTINRYWSSTTRPELTDNVYHASVALGYVSYSSKANNDYARCVR